MLVKNRMNYTVFYTVSIRDSPLFSLNTVNVRQSLGPTLVIL